VVPPLAACLANWPKSTNHSVASCKFGSSNMKQARSGGPSKERALANLTQPVEHGKQLQKPFPIKTNEDSSDGEFAELKGRPEMLDATRSEQAHTGPWPSFANSFSSARSDKGFLWATFVRKVLPRKGKGTPESLKTGWRVRRGPPARRPVRVRTPESKGCPRCFGKELLPSQGGAPQPTQALAGKR